MGHKSFLLTAEPKPMRAPQTEGAIYIKSQGDLHIVQRLFSTDGAPFPVRSVVFFLGRTLTRLNNTCRRAKRYPKRQIPFDLLRALRSPVQASLAAIRFSQVTAEEAPLEIINFDWRLKTRKWIETNFPFYR